MIIHGVARLAPFAAEAPMELKLSEREAELLRELLRDYLPGLRREAARTDKHSLRQELVERENLVEHLLDRLPSGVH